MYSVGAPQELRSFYNDEGRLTTGGLTSFLLTQTAEQSRNFAEKHFSDFNDISASQWHLSIFARVERQAGDRWIWHRDDDLHAQSQALRAKITSTGIGLPSVCLVFLDPDAGPLWADEIAVIEVDYNKIGDIPYMQEGHRRIHNAIMRAFQAEGIDDERPITGPDHARMMHALSRELNRQQVTGFLRKLGPALVGFVFDLLMGRVK
ncbi:MAG: hypothetical protein Q4G26_14920 [Paracoccus sp. (in: a-proteobacteria)]|nr:hypothetical protein [Paracoccus sp. (in: a-proteobacteria)]